MKWSNELLSMLVHQVNYGWMIPVGDWLKEFDMKGLRDQGWRIEEWIQLWTDGWKWWNAKRTERLNNAMLRSSWIQCLTPVLSTMFNTLEAWRLILYMMLDACGARLVHFEYDFWWLWTRNQSYWTLFLITVQPASFVLNIMCDMSDMHVCPSPCQSVWHQCILTCWSGRICSFWA